MSKENLKKSIEFVKELFEKSASFGQRYKLHTQAKKSWSLSSSFREERSITASARPLNEQESKELEAIAEKVAEKYNSDNDVYSSLEEFEISQGLQVGQPFPHYTKLKTVSDETETEILHQKGEVILLDVWATWCGPCQRPMQHNQDMLTKNAEKWTGKVRIIAVSVDDDNEGVKKRIQERNWDKITHMKLNGWDGDHAIIKDYKIRGIPFVALVDTQGLIYFTGHPSDIDLEDKINQLLEANNNSQSGEGKQNNSNSAMTQGQYKEGKTLLKNTLVEKKKTLDNKDTQYSFVVNLTKKSTITHDSVTKEYQPMTYSATLNKKYQQAYDEFKKYILTTLGENYPIKKQREQIQDIKQSMTSDFKELEKIYVKHKVQQIENQHCVTMQLKLVKNKLVSDKEEYLYQHKKIFVEKDANKDHFDLAIEDQAEFAINKYQSGQYADYLRKLYQKGIQTTHEVVVNPVCHEESYRKIKPLFSDKDLLDLEFDHQLPYNPQFKITLKRHRVFNYKGDMKRKYYGQAKLSYTIRSSDEENFKKNVLDKLFSKINKNDFKIKEEILKVAEIPEGKTCNKCNAELTLPYYYNYFCKEHYCITCGDKRDESINTIKSFAIPHNLVLIPTSDPAILKNVDEYKIGKDVQPKEEEELDFEFQYGCNGCGAAGNSRYICLSCRPGPYQDGGFIDFCGDCLKKQVFEKDNEFITKLASSDPLHKSDHLYLKVLTAIGQYKNH